MVNACTVQPSNDAVPQAKKAGGLEAVVHRCQVAYTVDVAALLEFRTALVGRLHHDTQAVATRCDYRMVDVIDLFVWTD